MRALLAAIGFGAALFMSACATNPPDPIAGAEWTLERLEGAPEGLARQPTLSFEDGRAAGFAGCNRYFATATRAGGDALTFSEAGATRMYCEGAPMQMETLFLAMLGRVKTARVEDGVLTLFDASGAELARLRR